MSKKIRKSEVIDMANNETENEVYEETMTAKVGKTKWSLKKKLLIGGGIVGGLILGAVALGTSKKTKPENDQPADYEDENEEVSNDEVVSEEIPANVEE